MLLIQGPKSPSRECHRVRWISVKKPPAAEALRRAFCHRPCSSVHIITTVGFASLHSTWCFRSLCPSNPKLPQPSSSPSPTAATLSDLLAGELSCFPQCVTLCSSPSCSGSLPSFDLYAAVVLCPHCCSSSPSATLAPPLLSSFGHPKLPNEFLSSPPTPCSPPFSPSAHVSP